MSMSVSITVVGQDWADVRRQMAGILASPMPAMDAPVAGAEETPPAEEKKKAGRPPKAVKAETPKADAPKPEADPFTADALPPTAPLETAITRDQAMGVLKEYMAKEGMPKTIELLQKAAGVKLFREVKDADLQKVVDAVKAAK